MATDLPRADRTAMICYLIAVLSVFGSLAAAAAFRAIPPRAGPILPTTARNFFTLPLARSIALANADVDAVNLTFISEMIIGSASSGRL